VSADLKEKPAKIAIAMTTDGNRFLKNEFIVFFIKFDTK